VQSSAFDLPPLPFELQPRTRPRALTETEIVEVAQALAVPEIVGPYKVAIVDPPRADVRLDELRSWRSRLGDDMRLGLFGPFLRVAGPPGAANELVSVPPCGHVCGAFAAAERESGIHRTGANRPLRFVEGLTLAIGEAEQGILNPVGINAIRAFPGRGIRVNGSRTLSSDPEWRFLTSRRIVDAIEKTLESALAWVVFEPNNVLTRHTVTVAVSGFLDLLWRNGVLAGSRPEAAYTVKCDTDNNTDADQAEGRLTIDIGVAPTEPYEFVLFRLGHAQDALKVTE
jgi:phage tail sheath protein FI